MSRSEDAIDLIALYSRKSSGDWNRYLTKCLRRGDVAELARMRYRLQAGMADLAKRKLNTDKMIHWFIRLQNSVENTIKRIVREKNPNPCDDPLKAPQHIESLADKRKRDHDVETFLRNTGY